MPSGAGRVNRTLKSSILVNLVFPGRTVKGVIRGCFRPLYFSQLILTDSALKGSPLWKITPRLSLNSIVLLFIHLQSSARHGAKLLSLSTVTSPSTQLCIKETYGSPKSTTFMVPRGFLICHSCAPHCEVKPTLRVRWMIIVSAMDRRRVRSIISPPEREARFSSL